ncbi:hypothetical protein KR054_011946, partial [Drosophila jambulina]
TGPDASFNYSIWKLTSRFKRVVVPKAPLKDPAVGWCYSNAQKAEVFANSLEERFKPLDLTTPVIRRAVEIRMEEPFQMCLPAQPVTLPEVMGLIKKLKTKKAPGVDGLNNRTLKLLPKKAILFLVLLFNSILRIGHFPMSWKTALITMVPKPGVPQGSVLGPTLYTLYTADMPTASAIAGIDENDVLIATFADDTAVLTRSPIIHTAWQALQSYVHSFDNWAKTWNIGVNSSKCANVTFS